MAIKDPQDVTTPLNNENIYTTNFYMKNSAGWAPKPQRFNPSFSEKKSVHKIYDLAYLFLQKWTSNVPYVLLLHFRNFIAEVACKIAPLFPALKNVLYVPLICHIGIW